MKTLNWAVLLISIALVLVSVPLFVSAQPNDQILIQSTATVPPTTGLVERAGIGISNEGDVLLVGMTTTPVTVTPTGNVTVTPTVNITNVTKKVTTAVKTPTIKPTKKVTTTRNVTNVTRTVAVNVTTMKNGNNAFVTGTAPVQKYNGPVLTPFTTLIVGFTTSPALNSSSYTHTPFQSWMWQ